MDVPKFISGEWFDMALEFGQSINMDNLEVDPGGQGQRSRSPGPKKRDFHFRPHFTGKRSWIFVKG